MIVSSPLGSGATLIDNTFIDNCMAQANGEFVKVYLYLVRCAQSGREVSISAIADFFEQTERDVKRALKYWKSARLIDLQQDRSGHIVAIHLLQGQLRQSAPSAQKEEAEASAPAVNSGGISVSAAAPVREAASGKESRQLQRAELSRLVYVAETYFQRSLSSSEISMLDYFVGDLGMSADLVEYLLEYCIGKNHTSVRYMEKIARDWKEKGVTEVSQARDETRSFGGDYTAIFRELGLSRQPAPAEMTIMDKWLSEYAFSLDIIREACRRTVLQTSQPSLNYADGILTSWHGSAVRTMDDIRRLDKGHAERRKEKDGTSAKSSDGSASNRGSQKSARIQSGRFNNFTHEDVDWNAIGLQVMKKQKQES